MAKTYRLRNSVPKKLKVRDGDCNIAYDKNDKKYSSRKWRRNPYNKEEKHTRKNHYKKYRCKCKQLLKKDKWEKIVPYTKTSGWLSW